MSGLRERALLILGVAQFAIVGVGALSCMDQSDQRSEQPIVAITSEADAPIKNIILVSLDTLRADHMGLYGYERSTTPNLDAFASQSVVFERATSQASSTRPSHMSLFQSRPASATTRDGLALAEVLAKNGFRTAAFTDGGNISSKIGFARGFEIYEDGGGGLAESLPKAASWIREHRRERFFLFLHTYDIHLPYEPPEPHASMFTESYDGDIRGDNTRPTLRRVRSLDEDAGAIIDLDSDDRERVVALYDGGIHYTDDQLKHLFNLIDELGLYRDTLVVLFSDHGEEFWDHGLAIHSHSLFQELLHVPLIIRAPKFSAKRVTITTPLMDLSPTILEMLDIPVPRRFEGQSLTRLMAGEVSGHRVVISEQGGLKSWIDYPWKLIRGEGETDVQLFDLASDPLERNNLAAERRDTAEQLGKRLDLVVGEHGDHEVLELEPGIEDPEHIERLRALGYVE